jgi:hypothetical protein
MMFRLLPAAKSTDGASDLLTVAQTLMPQTTTTNPVFDWIAPRFVALPVSGGFGAFYVAGMKSVLQGDIPWLDSEIPSANGVMTARALAKMYGAIANDYRPAMRVSTSRPLASSGICGGSSFDISLFEAAAAAEGIAASSSRLPDACGVARSKNRSSSTGKGSTRVEFFSAATSTTVSKSRN